MFGFQCKGWFSEASLQSPFPVSIETRWTVNNGSFYLHVSYLIFAAKSFVLTLFQQADPVPDVWENCKDEVLAKAANELDPEVGCVLASKDFHSSYIKILKAVSYLNNPEVFFLATNMDDQAPYSNDLILPGRILQFLSWLFACGQEELLRTEINVFFVGGSGVGVDLS